MVYPNSNAVAADVVSIQLNFHKDQNFLKVTV